MIDRSLISIDWDNFYIQEIAAVLSLALDFAVKFPRTSVTAQSSSLGIDVHKEWLIAELLNVGDRFIFLEDDTRQPKTRCTFSIGRSTTYQPMTHGHVGLRLSQGGGAGPDAARPMLSPAELRALGLGHVGRSLANDLARWLALSRPSSKRGSAIRDPNGHFDFWWKRHAEKQNLHDDLSERVAHFQLWARTRRAHHSENF